MIESVSGLLSRMKRTPFKLARMTRTICAGFLRILSVRDAETAEASVNHVAKIKHGDQPEFFGFLNVSDIERCGIDGARDQGGETIAGTADRERGNIAVRDSFRLGSRLRAR